MISALISGRLYGTPQSRTGRNGNAFVTAKVRAAAGDESVLESVITFSASSIEALLALGDGDAVALAGELTPKVWTDRDGNAKPALDLVANQVMTLYGVGKKRKRLAHREDSARAGDEPHLELAGAAAAADAESIAVTEYEFDDKLPF